GLDGPTGGRRATTRGHRRVVCRRRDDGRPHSGHLDRFTLDWIALTGHTRRAGRSRDRHMKEAPTGCPTGARGIQTIRPMRGRPTAPAAEPPRVFRVTPGYDVLGLDSAALDSAVASAALVSPADSTSPCAVVVSASAESLFAWSS